MPGPGRPAGEAGGDHRLAERLQRAGDVDALAAGHRARLDRAVAAAEPEVRHGDGPVDRRVEGDGEDHLALANRLPLARLSPRGGPAARPSSGGARRRAPGFAPSHARAITAIRSASSPTRARAPAAATRRSARRRTRSARRHAGPERRRRPARRSAHPDACAIRRGVAHASAARSRPNGASALDRSRRRPTRRPAALAGGRSTEPTRCPAGRRGSRALDFGRRVDPRCAAAGRARTVTRRSLERRARPSRRGRRVATSLERLAGAHRACARLVEREAVVEQRQRVGVARGLARSAEHRRDQRRPPCCSPEPTST